jgi:hypothetical protein
MPIQHSTRTTINAPLIANENSMYPHLTPSAPPSCLPPCYTDRTSVPIAASDCSSRIKFNTNTNTSHLVPTETKKRTTMHAFIKEIDDSWDTFKINNQDSIKKANVAGLKAANSFESWMVRAAKWFGFNPTRATTKSKVLFSELEPTSRQPMLLQQSKIEQK